MAGLEPLVVFWTGWGIHFMVVVSFTVQVTLLLASDIRRRRDWPVLKVVIWSAYMLADTTAIYALGHMSVVCRSPEHHLMALWAPLLLVHLGGQDNITAYAIEDNRLWLRHLQIFFLQVTAAGYVMYVSSILFHPSKLRSAAILMFLVGVLKYGERIWVLMRADSCASSSLSATSYDKVSVSRTAGDELDIARAINKRNRHLIVAYSLLDVPKQMFEGPTSYVQISNTVDNNNGHEGKDMLRVVELQLSMMYDLLYTKAAMVHTWYGLCSRGVISLPFTMAALALFRSSSLGAYKRADVAITNVLLTGAVVLETMSVLRAIFSKWTAVLLFEREWSTIGTVVAVVEFCLTFAMSRLVRSGSYWSGRMRQHSLFKLAYHSNYSIGSKMAKKMGVEDWWDSNVYFWSTKVPELAIRKVLKLVSSTTIEDITKSQGRNAIQRSMNNNGRLVTWIWTWRIEELKLEERILVWHIATHVYRWWYEYHAATNASMWAEGEATVALADYMFFLLAARPYMLPYPVSRRAYVQLCSDAVTHLTYGTESDLVKAVLNQKEALMEGNALQPDKDLVIVGRRQGDGGETGAAAQPQPSMNIILDRGCQLAAKLIHITATPQKNESTTVKRSRKKQRQQREEIVDGNEDLITGQTETFSVNNGEVVLNKIQYKVVLNMVSEVWAEILCYTANLCNENYHAKHLTDGGEIMTIITLLMIYMQNGLIREDTTTSGTAAGPSSSQGSTATATATDIDSVV